MSEFEAGDLVECMISDYGNVDKGEVRKVIKVNKRGNRMNIEGGEGLDFRYECRDFKPAWTPEVGDKIMVSDDEAFENVYEREFYGMFDGFFMVYGDGNYGRPMPVPFKYARPIKKTKTLIDADSGRKIEVSEESHKAIFGEEK